MTEPVEHYLLGLPEMDEQHSHLYRVFDLLEDSPRVVDSTRTKAILEEIERYVLFHFTSEEHLMRRYGYNRFTEHQNDHASIESRLVNYLDDFETGNLNPGRMKAFLSAWLDEHSRLADSLYVDWINERRRALFFPPHH